jgi:hypothetical protein
VLRHNAWDEAVRRVEALDLTKAGEKLVQWALDRVAGNKEQAQAQYARTKPKLDGLAAEVVRAYGLHLLEKAFAESIRALEYKTKHEPTEWGTEELEKMRAVVKPAALNNTFDRYRQAMNAFSSAARWMNEPEPDAWIHNVRITEPIGMSGKNRITVVGEIQETEEGLSYIKTIIFHWGVENRGAWLENFRKNVGGTWRAIDAAGNLLDYELAEDYESWTGAPGQEALRLPPGVARGLGPAARRSDSSPPARQGAR